jgi:hypothetical protein
LLAKDYIYIRQKSTGFKIVSAVVMCSPEAFEVTYLNVATSTKQLI